MMMLTLVLAFSVQVEQAKVDDAIRRGAAFLGTAPEKNFEELVLLTLVHAGVPQSDPKLQGLLQAMLEKPLASVYRVSLQAMILEELHRVKYQGRIKECAQFLVDNQCRNGQWSYGTPLPAPAGTPSEGSAPVSSGAVRDFGEKPKVVRKLSVQKMREGPATGDNSNSQYAALGLRACRDAGVTVPREVLARAKRWWVESQHKSEDKDSTAVATGVEGDGKPRGWCYDHEKVGHKDAYGSMTAGAVGALAILDNMLDGSGKSDKAVKDGMAWLAKNWSVTENVGPCQHAGGDLKAFWLYTLYALERAGILAGVEKIGGHDWYQEGALEIVKAQKPDGSWNASKYRHNVPVSETCFAILFLKRATRPLVASQDKYHPVEQR